MGVIGVGDGMTKRVAYVPELERQPELGLELKRVLAMADRFPAVEFALRQALGLRADVLEVVSERALGQSIKLGNFEGMAVGPAGFMFEAGRQE